MAKWTIGTSTLLIAEITAWSRPQQAHLSVYLLPSLFFGVTTYPKGAGHSNFRAGVRFLMIHVSVMVVGKQPKS